MMRISRVVNNNICGDGREGGPLSVIPEKAGIHVDVASISHPGPDPEFVSEVIPSEYDSELPANAPTAGRNPAALP